MIKVFKVTSIELLNLDLTLHKSFTSLNLCKAYLGTSSVNNYLKHKSKRTPYPLVTHRTTKVKYYVKVITEIDN